MTKRATIIGTDWVDPAFAAAEARGEDIELPRSMRPGLHLTATAVCAACGKEEAGRRDQLRNGDILPSVLIMTPAGWMWLNKSLICPDHVVTVTGGKDAA